MLINENFDKKKDSTTLHIIYGRMLQGIRMTSMYLNPGIKTCRPL